MEQDVLLPIGSIVKVEPHREQIQDFMIIGRRVVSDNSLRSWDYISIPFATGLQRDLKKSEKGITASDNFFYFNHYDIEEIVWTMKKDEILPPSKEEEDE